MLSMAHARIKVDDKKRIAEVIRLREKIERESATLAEQQAIQRSKTFYHFGKIPFEIAMMIFSFVLEGNPAKIVRLAQVCKDWRATLFNSPFLWRTLSLDHRNPARKAKAWKERCRGIIEYLHLRGDIWPALDVLQKYDLTRLRGLTLNDVSPGKLIREFPALTPSVMSRLDSIDIQYPGTLTVEWMWKAPEMQLQHFNLGVSHNSWSTLVVNVKHLRSFTYRRTLESRYFPHLRSLLHGNQHLRSLDLLVDIVGPPDEAVDGEDMDLPKVLPMQHLESLCLSGRPTWVTRLVTWLQLPQLRILKFRALVVDSLLNHLIRANVGHALTELYLELCVVNIGTLTRFLETSTKLEYLQLPGVSDTKICSLLEALAGVSEEGGESQEVPSRKYLCPSLRHLDLTGSTSLLAGPVLRLVKHRNLKPGLAQTGQQVSKIETLIIDRCPLFDPVVLPWLREMVPKVSCVYMSKKEAKWKR